MCEYQKPRRPRRVDVLRRVRVLVVPAVVARPPEHALLRGALRAEGEQELEPARRLERAVREVAVVGRRSPRTCATKYEPDRQRDARQEKPSAMTPMTRRDVNAPERHGRDADVAGHPSWEAGIVAAEAETTCMFPDADSRRVMRLS